MIKKVFGAALAGAALLIPAVSDTATAGPAPSGIPASGIPSAESPGRSKAASRDEEWRRVGDGITAGISGLAAAGRHGGTADALAVRDNKKPGENRLVAVWYSPDAKPRAHEVTWRGEQPVDLEAIDAVPGRDGTYVAVSSSGTAYLIQREIQGEAQEETQGEGDTVRVLRTTRLPGVSADDNYEGFALIAVQGTIAAVWADRGQDDRPGKLTAAEWNPRTHTFGQRDSKEFRVPYPTRDVRHISDVKVAASGALTVSSASDPGDDGPYDSALYDAGRVLVGRDGDVRLSLPAKPHRLATFPGHKIEALLCLPRSREGILGTDDENDGGSLTAAALCRP
ncbi:hypothetical protein [Streptomyces sp. NPDC017993]|uniref:hypothetical protein n=1 Tax=Streptomyces sp. NPDC017993 TaxID=3365027 RepID=UPI0037B91919